MSSRAERILFSAWWLPLCIFIYIFWLSMIIYAIYWLSLLNVLFPYSRYYYYNLFYDYKNCSFYYHSHIIIIGIIAIIIVLTLTGIVFIHAFTNIIVILWLTLIVNGKNSRILVHVTYFSTRIKILLYGNRSTLCSTRFFILHLNIFFFFILFLLRFIQCRCWKW